MEPPSTGHGSCLLSTPSPKRLHVTPSTAAWLAEPVVGRIRHGEFPASKQSADAPSCLARLLLHTTTCSSPRSPSLYRSPTPPHFNASPGDCHHPPPDPLVLPHPTHSMGISVTISSLLLLCVALLLPPATARVSFTYNFTSPRTRPNLASPSRALSSSTSSSASHRDERVGPLTSSADRAFSSAPSQFLTLSSAAPPPLPPPPNPPSLCLAFSLSPFPSVLPNRSAAALLVSSTHPMVSALPRRSMSVRSEMPSPNLRCPRQGTSESTVTCSLRARSSGGIPPRRTSGRPHLPWPQHAWVAPQASSSTIHAL